MKAKGVYLVGTDFTTQASHEMGMDEYHAMVVARLKRAYQVGVPVAFGTDVCLRQGGRDARHALDGVRHQLRRGGRRTPKQILQAMTVSAAKLMGMEKERGAIAPGFAADIVATPENPLQNIDAVRHVAFVMKGGQGDPQRLSPVKARSSSRGQPDRLDS